MKLDFERRSGLSFDDVRVHYNSDKPRKIGALAYTQIPQVHIGPGQERHLRHELGHVVQQKQGIVRPTVNENGVSINNDPVLESAASASIFGHHGNNSSCNNVIQRILISYFDFNNAATDEEKIKYFQRTDISIDQWIITAYEYEKQKAIRAPDGSTPSITAHDILSKLYSISELIAESTKTLLPQSETVTLVTHGDKAGRIQLNTAGESVSRDLTLTRIRACLSKKDDHFFPFFCYMGTSDIVKEIYRSKVAVEGANGPSLLPPGDTEPHGHGYIYDEEQLFDAINALRPDTGTTVPTWDPIINQAGCFRPVKEVIENRNFPKLKCFCEGSFSDLNLAFITALNEVILEAFPMYTNFFNAINTKLGGLPGRYVDVGKIFAANRPSSPTVSP